MKWNPFSDWLPLENAQAQVKFWETDLKYAEDYLQVVQQSPDKNFPRYKKNLDIAIKDVKVSKQGLANAKIKLAESEKLEKQGRT